MYKTDFQLHGWSGESFLLVIHRLFVSFCMRGMKFSHHMYTHANYYSKRAMPFKLTYLN